MRAVLVVVANILREQAFQVAFVNCDDVIQQITTTAAYPAFCNSILPGTPDRSANTLDSHGPNRRRDLHSILGVPIEDKKLGSGLIWKGFSQLLDNPQASRMLGDVEVQDASTAVADDEEAIERAEGDRRNGEEVHRGDSFPVVAQKGEPALGKLRIFRRSFHPAGDRSLGEIKTEHEEFAMYPRRSPGRVLGDHPENQLPNPLRCRRSPNLCSDSGDQPPIQTEAGPVPPNHRFRRDDDEGLLPTRPDSPGDYPEEFIEKAEDRPWTAPLQHSELLPEREILQEEMPTTTKRANKRSEPEKKQIEHGPELYQINDGKYCRMLLILQSARFWRTTTAKMINIIFPFAE
jgi:hypothetical protein